MQMSPAEWLGTFFDFRKNFIFHLFNRDSICYDGM